MRNTMRETGGSHWSDRRQRFTTEGLSVFTDLFRVVSGFEAGSSQTRTEPGSRGLIQGGR